LVRGWNCGLRQGRTPCTPKCQYLYHFFTHSVDSLKEASWMLMSSTWDLWYYYSSSVNTAECQLITVL
jgi:hypothetical protein